MPEGTDIAEEVEKLIKQRERIGQAECQDGQVSGAEHEIDRLRGDLREAQDEFNKPSTPSTHSA